MDTLSQITTRAHAIHRDRRGFCSFAEALRMSWAIARGYSAGFETSYLKAGRIVRVMGFAKSTDEARTACREAKRWIIAEGFKPTGDSIFNLAKFVPTAEGIQTIETPAPVVVQLAA
jgi:hypothetical protein